MAFGPSGGALSASSEANRNYNPNAYNRVAAAPRAPTLGNPGMNRAAAGAWGSPRPDRGMGGIPRQMPGGTRAPTGPLLPGRGTTGGIGGSIPKMIPTPTPGQNGNMAWRGANGQNLFYRAGPNGRIWDYGSRGWASPALAAMLQASIPRSPTIPGRPPGQWTPPMSGTPRPGIPGRTPPIWGGGGIQLDPREWDGTFNGGINPGGMYNNVPTRGLPQLPVNQGRTMLPPPAAMGLGNQSFGLPAPGYVRR